MKEPLFIFERSGEIARDCVLENHLWVDVGNRDDVGVFDHHQKGGLRSSFEAVLTRTKNYDGLKRYLSEHTEEDTEVTFHVHAYPDVDCIFSVYAIRKMIEQRAENPGEVFGARTKEKLLEYVNAIDSGHKKLLSKPTLYAYVCKIGVGIENAKERSQKVIDEGCKLADMVVNALEENPEIDLFTQTLDEYLDVLKLDCYESLKEIIKNAESSYQNDKAYNRMELMQIGLWDKDNRRAEPVKAAVWKKRASDEDLYAYAREKDNCVLTVYYPKLEEGRDDSFTRVIISLNPDAEGGENLTILPFAEILEQMEQIEEEKYYVSNGRYRRDHSMPRDVEGHFSVLPFSETSDPWYISQKEDMIDGPRAGTLLSYDQILSVILNSASKRKNEFGETVLELSTLFRNVDYASYYKSEGEEEGVKVSAEEHAEVSFGDVYNTTRGKLMNMKGNASFLHLLAVVKIDPVMLQYNNDILKASCLNMVGKTGSMMSQENLLCINYSSFLYTDQSITIVAYAKMKGQDLSFLEGRIDKSRIGQDIKKLLENRLELMAIGSSLTEKIQKMSGIASNDERTDEENTGLSTNIDEFSERIERFNERIVRLSTKIEEDSVIVDPLEQDIYAAIKSSFKINELKESVIDSANLLIKNAEQKRDEEVKKDRRNQENREKKESAKEKARDNRLQAGIGLMTIVGVFSAWVDSFDFFAKIVPKIDGGWNDVWDTKWVFWLEVVLTIGIFVLAVIVAKYSWNAYQTAIKEEKSLIDNEKEDSGQSRCP